ncbi:MAG: CHAT domain-containing tetratricopeptide repeat protein [Chitinophagales bacterium]
MKGFTVILTLFLVGIINLELFALEDSLSREEQMSALEVELSNEKNDTAIFHLYVSIADLLSKENKHEQAISYLHKGLQLGEQLNYTATPDFIDLLNDYAYNLIEIKKVKEAEQLIRLHIDKEIKDWRYVKLCFYYSQCLESLGDINLAQLYLEKAFSISEEIDNERYILRSLARLSRIYMISNDLKKIKFLENALTKYNYLDRQDQLKVVQFNIAAIYKDNAQYDKAIELFDEIIAWGKKNDHKQFSLLGYINKASCLRDMERLEEAKTLYRKAIQIDSTQSIIYDNLAEIYWTLGDYDMAIELIEKALSIEHIDINNYNFTETVTGNILKYPYKEDILSLFHDLARSHKAKAEQRDSVSTIKAIRLFYVLDKIVNEVRFSTIELKSQHFWRNEVKPIYDDALEVAFILDDTEMAFYFSEKSKAILLLDDLVKNTTALKNQIPEALIQKETTLKQDIFDLEIQFVAGLSAAEKDSLQNLILDKKLAFSNLIHEIYKVSPQYVNTIYEPPLISLSELQSKLKSKETIVNYVWSDTKIFRFIITQKDISIAKIEIDEDFKSDLIALISSLKITNTKKETYQLQNEKLYHLYEKILGNSVELSDHLIVLPDGLLSFLPFEAIVTNDNFEEPDYLIQDHVISYGFSVNTLNTKYIKSKNRSIVAFAPEEYLPELKLSKLSFSEFELEPIIKAKAKLYKGELATKREMLAQLSHYNIIHIYSHAEADNDANGYPWIAAHDDLILLPEIYNSKNNADLILLSACETNLGKQVNGEGVISLARGFFHAGSKSVLASLWKVNDKSSSEIIHYFYQYLKEGNTKAEALRLSKLRYIENHKIESMSPYYWAGVVYIGKDGELQLGQRSYKPYLLALALVVLLGSISFYWIRKGRKRIQ